jgi:hypothetical protein
MPSRGPRYNINYVKRWMRERLLERQRERQRQHERLHEFGKRNEELQTQAIIKANATKNLNFLKIDFTDSFRGLSASDWTYLWRRQGKPPGLQTLLAGRDLRAVWALEDAIEDVRFNRQECRQHLNLSIPKDLALDIVAHFHELAVNQLVNYSKNRNRK